MTSSSKTAAAIILAALLSLPAFAAGQSVMQRGDLTLDRQRTVEDVVVADGNLVVSGRVTGSVFLVNGDALISPSASVEGNLTVLGGGLWVSKGAAVRGEINVLSGQAHIEEGADLGSEVRAIEEVSSLTPDKLAIISRYVIFSRQVPAETYPLSNLSRLTLENLRLHRGRDRRMVQLDLFEMGSAALNLEEVEDSREFDFRGHDLRVRVCAIRFSSPAGADSFWEKLRSGFEDKAVHSVHNSLGDGAHWFFRYRGASYCLWYRDRTFQAVMVRHDDNDPEADEWNEVEDLRDRIILELKDMYDLTGE